MSAHSVVPQLFYSGVWNVINSDVLNEAKIQITRGYTPQFERRPAKITWTFNNVTDKYRPTNPSSVLYGLVGRNIPAACACDSSVRAVVEAASYAPDQTEGFTVGPPIRGHRWVDFTGEGLLRRIGRWSEALRSPMYRQISQYAAIRGYWPLEDPTGALQLTNVYPGPPGSFTGITLRGGDGPAGSDDVVKSSDTSVMGGRFGNATGSNWQFFWSAKLATLPAVEYEVMNWTSTNGYKFQFFNANTGPRIQVSQGTTILLNMGSTYGGLLPTSWTRWRVKVSVSAGTVSVEPSWLQENNVGPVGFTGTFAGTTGQLGIWKQEGNTGTLNALYGHVGGITTIVDDLESVDAQRSFDGYRGETAAARFQRLCTELKIARTVVGTVSLSWPMGKQRSARFEDLLDEIERTEDGLIFDTALSLSLTFRTRLSLYNQTPKMALTYPGDIAPPFREVLDDEGVHNKITVAQAEGGEAYAEQTTGPLNTQAVPAGIGEYRQQVDVNVYTEADLPLLAGWWKSRGTVDGARYPQVVIDLDGTPALTTTANSVDIGDRLTVTGREPEVIGLIVIGIDETVETHRRKITFTCVRDQVWNPAKYDATSPTTVRYDSASTVVNFAQTTTSTSWAIKTDDPTEVWSTTGVPYPWQVTGERVTCTAITAAAGTGPYTQTATVTRSVNGVVKAHAVGDVIMNADPARYAL